MKQSRKVNLNIVSAHAKRRGLMTCNEYVPLCRNTLLNYRNAGIIVEKRKGRKLIYTDEDIEILKKQI